MINNIYNKFRRITTNQLYFPEIDGIRFLAILLVVLFHIHGYFTGKNTFRLADDPNQYDLLNTFLRNGDRGVEFFFVLSGFILCLPFAHQYINHGKKVHLKKYYLRRVTRLEPPYFLAMTGIFLMQLAMKVHPANVLLPSWLASLVYAHNFIFHHAPLLTVVAWSLEIEIQFYIMAPLLFRVLALGKIPRRMILTAGMIALITCQRFYPLPPQTLNIYGFAQYFLAGILLSDFYVSDTYSAFFKKNWLALPAVITLITIIFLPIKNLTVSEDVVFASRMALPFLLCFFYYIVMKNPAVKKVFSYKFVPIIGGMCYSIYLLHYTVISIFGRVTMHARFTGYYIPNLALQIVVLCIPVLIFSSIFYLYIERPFMSSKWLDMIMKKGKKTEEANMQAEVAGDGNKEN